MVTRHTPLPPQLLGQPPQKFPSFILSGSGFRHAGEESPLNRPSWTCQAKVEGGSGEKGAGAHGRVWSSRRGAAVSGRGGAYLSRARAAGQQPGGRAPALAGAWPNPHLDIDGFGAKVHPVDRGVDFVTLVVLVGVWFTLAEVGRAPRGAAAHPGDVEALAGAYIDCDVGVLAAPRNTGSRGTGSWHGDAGQGMAQPDTQCSADCSALPRPTKDPHSSVLRPVHSAHLSQVLGQPPAAQTPGEHTSQAQGGRVKPTAAG